jgi:hypothetical protein
MNLDLASKTTLTLLLHLVPQLPNSALKLMVVSDVAWNAKLHATATLIWSAVPDNALMNLHKALTLDQLAMLGILNMEVKLKTDL